MIGSNVSESSGHIDSFVKTHVEQCEFYPVVFQVFNRITKVWVEGARHRPQVDTEGLSSSVKCETPGGSTVYFLYDGKMGDLIYPGHI